MHIQIHKVKSRQQTITRRQQFLHGIQVMIRCHTMETVLAGQIKQQHQLVVCLDQVVCKKAIQIKEITPQRE